MHLDKASLLKEAITHCKDLLELHGSYAYMMLAEAYFHYAQWGALEGDHQLAEKAITTAIKSCSLAAQHLDKSTQSIYNASLGRGLAQSNSFKIEKPEEAQALLTEWLANQTSKIGFSF